jgi:hypothetical protein
MNIIQVSKKKIEYHPWSTCFHCLQYIFGKPYFFNDAIQEGEPRKLITELLSQGISDAQISSNIKGDISNKEHSKRISRFASFKKSSNWIPLPSSKEESGSMSSVQVQ